VDRAVSRRHLTGLLLPGPIDGIALIARLKRDSQTTQIPIIVLTACAWNSERERAAAAGCDLFLSKPCPARTLLREIRRLLASPRLARGGRESLETARVAARLNTGRLL
jgi:CheY-like chemotaxis protein